MSIKTTVICCVVAVICLILGMLALEFLPLLPVFGVGLVLIAVMLFAAVLGTHAQDAIDSLIDSEIEHRRKINEIYKMLKVEKDGEDDGASRASGPTEKGENNENISD